MLYFVASRERVPTPFDDELIRATEDAIAGLRNLAQSGTIPPPLEDSPKCPRCSLVGTCLPDEINHLSRSSPDPRPVAVPNTEALPLYVQARGAKVAKSGETLLVTIDNEKVATARLAETSQVVLMGSIYITAPPAGAHVARYYGELGTATAAGSTTTRSATVTGRRGSGSPSGWAPLHLQLRPVRVFGSMARVDSECEWVPVKSFCRNRCRLRLHGMVFATLLP